MALDRERDDSVYDFLYVDARRIAVFLSQFSQYGHLTTLTRAVSETSSAGGGINLCPSRRESIDSAARGTHPG